MVQEQRVSYDPVVILAVDDESLDMVGRWPWPRDIIAEVVEDLASNGAKAVFVDVLYTENSPNPNEDQAWVDVLESHDNVYLPYYFQLANRQWVVDHQANNYIVQPIFDILSQNRGHINATEDKDRVVRQVRLGIRDDAGEMVPAMSVLLANQLLEDDEKIRWNDKDEWFIGNEKIPTESHNTVYFSYASTPASPAFETHSISRVIDGEIDPAYFENSIVLIGPYAVGFSDAYFVPNSNSQMFGIEIHANIIQSFLDGKLYQKIDDKLGLFIILIMATGSFFLMERLSAKWSLVALASFIALYFVSYKVVFTQMQLVLPLFYPILTLVLVYFSSLISQYVKERLERNRVTGIFGRYVAKSVVDEILSNTDEIKLGGERKDITLLFVDIRGFTPLSEKIEPEEVINILNEYLNLCTKAIFKYDGTVDKFMGDGVMAMFGAPIEQEDHHERAIRAALVMKEEADDLARRLEEKYGRSVRFGMGINSGDAVVGNIGSEERLDYTAIGDTVNLAARLEANAKPGQILISENTYERVKEKFTAVPLEPIKVKGKEKKVMIYQVEGEVE